MNPLKHKDKLRVKDRATMRVLQGLAAMFVAFLLPAAGPSDPVRADETATANPDAARLVEDVLRKAGGNDGESLGEWTRDVIERALRRAGGTARQTVPGSRLGGRDRSGGAGPPDRRPGQADLRAGGAGPRSPGQPTAPLPAERHAAGIARGTAGRGGTAEILIFTSLSVPAASWRQWLQEAALAGAPLVLRGVSEDGMRATAKEIGARIGSGAGIAIDPRLFRLFGVTRVPAVVVVPGGVPPCRSRGCAGPGSGSGAGDPAPPHDLVTGNIGLAAALEAVAAEGVAGRTVAQALLKRLRGNDRP